MLLELHSSVISDLLNSSEDLVQAVEKAKAAFLESLDKSAEESLTKCRSSNGTPVCDSKTEELGEIIFEKVVSVHPDDAPQITGTSCNGNRFIMQRSTFCNGIIFAVHIDNKHPLHFIL